LLNPAFFYDSWIWGQIESIYFFFTFAAILAAVYKHSNLSLILYTLAFYSKLQAVIFLPGLILLLLPQLTKNHKLILSGILSVLATHLLMFFPFILVGQIGAMYKNVMASVDYMPFVTANAYNFWVLVFGGEINFTSDKNMLFFLTYKTWGLLLFCSASALVLWKSFWSWVKKPRTIPEVNLEYVYKVLLVTGLIAIVFYYFPTQMHERYLQPAIFLFGTIFLLKPGKITGLMYLLISIAYFFNLERLMHYLNLPALAYKLMSSRLLSIMFTAVLLQAFYLLYQTEITQVLSKFKKQLTAGK
jgi:Gpi18-like mannosyltransferase